MYTLTISLQLLADSLDYLESNLVNGLDFTVAQTEPDTVILTFVNEQDLLDYQLTYTDRL